MFCKKCGASISDTGKFCPKCGTPVSLNARTPQRDVEARINQISQTSTNPYGKSDINTTTSTSFTMKKNICRKCGASISDTGKFCPKCGTPVSLNAGTPQWDVEARINQIPQTPVDVSPTRDSYGKREHGISVHTITSGSVATKKKNWKPVAIAIGSIVIAGAVATTMAVNAFATKPIPSLALGLNNLVKSEKNVKSFHMSASGYAEGSLNIDADVEINQKKEQFYLYGTLVEDGESAEFAVCIEGDAGGYSAIYDGDCYGDSIDSDLLHEMWENYEKTDIKDFNVQTYLEDLGLDDELNAYIDINKVDDVYQKFLKRLSKRSTQKDLENALQIETSKESGEHVYQVSPDGTSLINTSNILLDIFEEEAGTALRGNWLDEIRGELDNIDYEDLYELDNLGDFEWRTKRKMLTGLSYQFSLDGASMQADANFTYKRKKIKEIEANFTYSEGYDGININFLIDEINQVDDVKDKIPSDLLYEMNMD